MEDNKIPVFEKSGNGLSYDLQNLEKQKMVALGWWKGQFKKYLNTVTKKVWIDGVYCYDTDIRVGRNSCSIAEYFPATVVGEYFVEADIVDSLKLITDGSFFFTANGVTYDITELDFTSILTTQDIADVVNAKLSATVMKVNVDEEQVPVYCVTEPEMICQGEFGGDLYETIYHRNLQIETTSNGDNSSITELIPSSVGTFVGDLMLLTKDIEDGYSTGISTKVENTHEFLKTMGFTDDNIQQMCTDSRSEGVADINLAWTQDYDFDKEAFEYVVDLLKHDLPLYDKVEVFNSCVSYNASVYSAPYTPRSVSRSYSNLGQLNSADGTQPKIYDFPDIIYKDSGLLNMESQTIIVYNGGVDITSTISNSLLNVIKSILWISGNKAMNYVGSEVYSTQNFEVAGQVGSQIYVNVTTKETYDGTLKSLFTDEYKYYSTDCHAGYDEDGCRSGTYSSIYMNYLWLYREYDNTYQQGEEIAGLFYKSVKPAGFLTEGSSKLYMTVKGLDSISPRRLQEMIGTHANFSVVKKSCGSFFKCFFKALLSFIAELLRLAAITMYYMPQVRELTQILIWVFTKGEVWSNDRDEFVQYTTTLIAAAISIVISYFTIGLGTPAAIAFFAAMTAYTIYSTYSNIGEMRDSIEFQQELDKLEEKERKLIEEELDKAEAKELEEGEVDEDMFMPLDEQMKKIEKDQFGEDSIYTIKYK